MIDTAAATLPQPARHVEQAINDLGAKGIAIQSGFLDEDRRRVLLERVLEQAELERAQGVAELSGTGTASERQFAGGGAPPAPFQAISFLPNKGRPFVDLFMDERLHAYCRQAFGDVPYYLTSQTATIVREGAAAQVIHSDQQAWPFTTPAPALLTFVICLTDFTPDMGSTRFVPATQGLPPPEIGYREDIGRVGNLADLEPVPFTASAGALVCWDGRTWHGQGPSTSPRDRIGIIMTFAMHMVRAQDNYAALLHDHVYETLSDAERAMLGFEVHFEYAGRVAPRTPSDRRFNTNSRYPYVPELRRGSSAVAVPISDARIDHPSAQAVRH